MDYKFWFFVLLGFVIGSYVLPFMGFFMYIEPDKITTCIFNSCTVLKK